MVNVTDKTKVAKHFGALDRVNGLLLYLQEICLVEYTVDDIFSYISKISTDISFFKLNRNVHVKH